MLHYSKSMNYERQPLMCELNTQIILHYNCGVNIAYYVHGLFHWWPVAIMTVYNSNLGWEQQDY